MLECLNLALFGVSRLGRGRHHPHAITLGLTLIDWRDDCECFRKILTPPFFGDGGLSHYEIIGENPFLSQGGGHGGVAGAICPSTTPN